jgi:lysophospholipase L1-like esterase
MPEENRAGSLVVRRGPTAVMRRLLRLVLAALMLLVAAQGSALAAPASWDYVALGDSLATGWGAFRGYVPRYETHLETDTGVAVTLTNLGQNGWTSSKLLAALRNDPKFRQATSGAEVVTWDIGGNDLRAARSSYKNKTCGGTDNQDCLRAAVARLEGNWDAITAEVLSLRSTSNTIVRTIDIYNPYVKTDKAADTWQNDGGLNDFQVFKIYIDEVNAHIAATSTANNIPYGRVYLAFNGANGDEDPGAKGYLSWDRLHPNDMGHRIIAGKLRKLGYAPLRQNQGSSLQLRTLRAVSR